jgi:hypothetical protein
LPVKKTDCPTLATLGSFVEERWWVGTSELTIEWRR